MFGKLHVTPVVLSFLAAYPEVNVRVVLFDYVIDLVENHVDVPFASAVCPTADWSPHGLARFTG
jgi:DNA-binding transcriptional LysR family regulator